MAAAHNHACSKKPVEYYFIDMASPDRFRKLKVSQACDFCRRRKSKCDVGEPGSQSCSNCRKAGIVCVFAKHRQRMPTPSTALATKLHAESSRRQASVSGHQKGSKRKCVLVMATPTDTGATHKEESGVAMTPDRSFVRWIYAAFPCLEMSSSNIPSTRPYTWSVPPSRLPIGHPDQTLADLEQQMLEIYLGDIHPFFPVLDLHEQENVAHSLRFGLLALTCAMIRPDMASLASAYANQANEQLQRSLASDIANVQTLLLLHKYQELVGISLHTDNSSMTAPYLDQARDTHDRVWESQTRTPGVYRVQLILYLVSCWSGLAELSSTWKKWCRACDTAYALKQLASSGDDVALERLVESTQHYRQQQHPYSIPNNSYYLHLDPGASVFEPYICMIHDMTLVSTQHIYAAERIEQHVRHLAGTVAQHACVLGSGMLVNALKLALRAYVSYYATATISSATQSTISDNDDNITSWMRIRLTHLIQLFQNMGAQPDISTSIQQLVDMLCDGYRVWSF